MTNPAGMRPVTAKEFRRAVRAYARVLIAMRNNLHDLAVKAAVVAEMHDRQAAIEGSNERWYGHLDSAIGEMDSVMSLFTGIISDQPAPKG